MRGCSREGIRVPRAGMKGRVAVVEGETEGERGKKRLCVVKEADE